MNWKVIVLLLGAALPVSAQDLATSRTAQTIDESALVTLHGSVHPLARPEFDRGRVSDSLPMRRLLLTLARPADRERDLQQFLEDAHAPGSPAYHKWLTPEEYGARFGAADADAQVVSGWLQAHGFAIARISKGRSVIEFSGTAGQVREALHTEIHQYSVNGVSFYANGSGISVPQAVAARIGGFAPINSFPLDSYVKVVGSATLNRANHQASPRFTLPQGTTYFYAFGPEDFTTQYDVAPVYAAGLNGAGQTIGIIGEGNINLALVDAYRALFHLPAERTQMVIDGEDPGDGISPNVEGYLDAEVSGAVAPNATVNYYIAGGDPFEDSLSLAALRAVEDNQASVLSVSYGECERLLGEAGNQLWEGLWQQAAAQGQTVFVSSGDSGPTACPFGVGQANGSIVYTDSLSVSGLTSTPWNVSVGGTDFYYPGYASGVSSTGGFWNQTNDSSNGSLKAPLQEQAWDNALGLNIGSYLNSGVISVPSPAGGGGVSSCSQTTVPAPGYVPACIAGYAKPAWQNAPGVPNDLARDLPDVSLFAANGLNQSAVPICADPGDCAAVTSGEPQIFLVGGTSASSPAMAGVMALVDEKYGRQGQANYTLYGLARQFPSVFHDVTLGTNDVVCEPSTTPDCSKPVSGQPFLGLDSYGKYAAGAGYDLATGLGSLDVSQLVNNWNKVTYAATTTTLQATPASIVHGSAVTVSVAVAAGSGSGAGSAAPTGNVSLSAGPGTVIPANTPLTLANGAASAHVTNLPGGTYSLTAQYGGDGSFSSSTSAPVTLTVTPEASNTVLNLQYVSGAATGLNPFNYGTIVNGGQAPFGSAWSFEATPSSQATQTAGLATGTATFSDGGTTAVVPVGSGGMATWSPQNLAMGAHSIAVSYSGDASYAASGAGPVSFTVVKGTPTLSAVPEVQQVFGGTGFAYAAGSTLVVHVLVSQRGVPTVVPPTGSVTVMFSPFFQTTVALTPDLYQNQAMATALVTIPNIPAGTYSLSAGYSGDANWNAAIYNYPTAMTYTNSSASPTTTALTITPASVNSSGSVTFNASVQAMSPVYGAPSGLVLLCANGTLFGSFVVQGSSGNTATGSDTVPATEIPYGALQVVAEFIGGGFMEPSVSSAVPLTVTANDFSLSVAVNNLAIRSGESATVPVSLSGAYSAGVTVALSCVPSSASVSCSVSPGSASFTGSGTASLTISAFAWSSGASVPGAPGPDRRMPVSHAAVAGVFLLVMVLPGRRRGRMHLLSMVLLAALCFAAGCGGSPSGSGSQGTQGSQTPAHGGSYSVVVTGVSAGITHNAIVNFSVQ